MKRLLPFLSTILFGITSLVVFAGTLHAKPVDSLFVIQSPGSRPYECCFTLTVTSRQPKGLTISEFRVRIISGKATYVPGKSASPIDWDIFQSPKEIQWLSSTMEAEADSSESVNNFAFCVQDTGVYRMVWEARSIDSILSTDTLVLICGRRDGCDQAFFRPIASQKVCGVDIDLLNANFASTKINDFHVAILTPGVTFDTVGSRLPAPGWRIERARADTISFGSLDSDISAGQFLEGFRLFFKNAPDTSFRISYWTTYFGERICSDTARIQCGLFIRDSLFSRRTTVEGDTCCRDLLLKNTHVERSAITGFAVKIATPNARLSFEPNAPAGWTVKSNAGLDSVVFTLDNGLASGDSVVFAGVCFDNARALTDTLAYTWQTFSNGILVTEGIGSFICRRKLIECDSMTAQVDSTIGAASRCISLDLRNRNSRREAVTRVTVKVFNEGTRRQILSGTPPLGWAIESITTDSIIYALGRLPAGLNLDNFNFCVSLGDTTTADPLQVVWTTYGDKGAICTDTMYLKTIFFRVCDSVMIEESGSINPQCCYTIRFHNNNDLGQTLNGFVVQVLGVDYYLDNATAIAPWKTTTTSFPAISVGYDGSMIAPGEISPPFTFCVNASAVSTRPVALQLVWKTFSSGNQICTDTVTVVCVGGEVEEQCDTVIQLSAMPGDESCRFGYRIVNLHTPASTIDGVRFRILEGSGEFVGASGTGDAVAWDQVAVQQDEVLFRGGTIFSIDSTETFNVNIGNSDGGLVELEICTMTGDQVLCCVNEQVNCTVSNVDMAPQPVGFALYNPVPNPATATATIGYSLIHASTILFTITDAQGREVRRVERDTAEPGEYMITFDSADLPAGVYYYTLEANGERATRRMVIMK